MARSFPLFIAAARWSDAIGLRFVLTAADPVAGLLRLAVFGPRVVSGVLFVAMALIAPLVLHYKTHLSTNNVVHCQVLMMYTGGRALTLWAINVGPWPQAMAMVGMVISIGCFLYWSLELTAEEPMPVPTATAEDVRLAQARSEEALQEMRDLL